MLRRLRPLVLFVGVCSFGCSSDMASVSGLVTLDDKPLNTGSVSFHPVNGGPAATGAIDSSGRYSLVVGAGERLPPGDYIATVVATEPAKEPPNPSIAPAPGKPITPAKYGDVAKSDLKVTVKGGSNSLDLKLSSK